MKKIGLYIAAMMISALFGTSVLLAEITVKEISGEAAIKTGKRWVPLSVGAKLDKGSRVSTGVNSKVVIKFNRATVTLKPMTIVVIKESSATELTDSTVIGLNRGGVNAKVTKSDRIKTSFKISTPVATSSVRGTEEEVDYGPSGMTIRVIEGIIAGEGRSGSARLVRGNLLFRQGSDRPVPDSYEEYLKDNFFAKTDTDALTDDERGGNGFTGDVPGTTDFIDQFGDPAFSGANVNIDIIFN